MRWREALFGHYTAVRPTREGGAYLALLIGVLFGAVNTGNNLVYVVLGVLLGLLVVANVAAEWNLRGLVVERRLPPELFAGSPRPGGFVLSNPRSRGRAYAVEIEEQGPVSARAEVEVCEPLSSVLVPAHFSAPERGRVALGHVRVASSFPFGLVRRWRDLPLPGELLVYPAPLSRHHPAETSGEGDESVARGRPSWTGEFSGLRPWRPGDPLRRVHWPSSARTPTPVVAVRHGAQAEEVVVRVDSAATGQAREDAIGRATGRAELHLARGDAVGLELDGRCFGPRAGAGWRRRLLTELALAERR